MRTALAWGYCEPGKRINQSMVHQQIGIRLVGTYYEIPVLLKRTTKGPRKFLGAAVSDKLSKFIDLKR